MKKVTKLIPAVLPTMMLGTEEISVSRPPTLVSSASTNRKPRSRLVKRSLASDTALKVPTMIIAVTLLSTAEKTTVMTP